MRTASWTCRLSIPGTERAKRSPSCQVQAGAHRSRSSHGSHRKPPAACETKVCQTAERRRNGISFVSTFRRAVKALTINGPEMQLLFTSGPIDCVGAIGRFHSITPVRWPEGWGGMLSREWRLLPGMFALLHRGPHMSFEGFQLDEEKMIGSNANRGLLFLYY